MLWVVSFPFHPFSQQSYFLVLPTTGAYRMSAVGVWLYKLSSPGPLPSQSVLVPLTIDMTIKEKTKSHRTIEKWMKYAVNFWFIGILVDNYFCRPLCPFFRVWGGGHNLTHHTQQCRQSLCSELEWEKQIRKLIFSRFCSMHRLTTSLMALSSMSLDPLLYLFIKLLRVKPISRKGFPPSPPSKVIYFHVNTVISI